MRELTALCRLQKSETDDRSLRCNRFQTVLMPFLFKTVETENIILNVWNKIMALYRFWIVSHMNDEYIRARILIMISEVFQYSFHTQNYFISSQVIAHINRSCYTWDSNPEPSGKKPGHFPLHARWLFVIHFETEY